MTTRLWILGAADPEMAAIEALLRDSGAQTTYAIDRRTGERVTPASAYDRSCCTWVDPRLTGTEYDLIAVECWPSSWVTRRIDHHHSGDPGYGRPPAEFLPASSLGQVLGALARLRLLGRLARRQQWETRSGADGGVPSITGSITYCQRRWVVTGGLANYFGIPAWYGYCVPPALVRVAAVDHCLNAASRGECPGVDPDAVTRTGEESIR